MLYSLCTRLSLPCRYYYHKRIFLQGGYLMAAAITHLLILLSRKTSEQRQDRSQNITKSFQQPKNMCVFPTWRQRRFFPFSTHFPQNAAACCYAVFSNPFFSEENEMKERK